MTMYGAWIALGTLLSEDAALIAAGLLAASGELTLLEAVASAAIGIFCGDLSLYAAGRLASRHHGLWRVIHRFAPRPKIDRATEWLTDRGWIVVLLSRFTPGMRLPTYLAAGILPTNPVRFAAYFLGAALFWTPLLVGATAYLGARAAEQARGLLIALPAALLLITGVRKLGDWRTRRRLVGAWRRLARWEFWPGWAVYLPLAPYLAYLMLRHRSMTVFTAANPGMEAGGFVGESKSAILDELNSPQTARWTRILAALPRPMRLAIADRFLTEHGIQCPVVLKPDSGERGNGVHIVRTRGQLEQLLSTSAADVLLQEYIDGAEFGVFFVREPDQPRGRIVSITRKQFPEVVGDGHRTIEDLILRDPRAVCMHRTYVNRALRPPTGIPAEGERVPLVEVGSHCKGAVFLDGRSLLTPALEDAINRVCERFAGFHLGRFDVRAASERDLQEGRFRIIELNGVTSEPTHIYDPAVGILDAYRALADQWRIAFAIGARNRASGARQATVRELLTLLWSRFFRRRDPAPLPRRSRFAPHSKRSAKAHNEKGTSRSRSPSCHWSPGS